MEELLIKLKKHDVHLRVEDNNLKLNLPEGFTDNTLIDEIKKNKIDLIEYLNESKRNKINGLEISKLKSANPTKLTPPQARLYVLQGMAKESNVYNIPFACELNGAVNVPQLQSAFIQLIERHESLRTSFVLDDNYEPLQRVLKEFEFNLEHVKCAEAEVDQIFQEFSYAFDLRKAPLVRAKLLEVDDNKFILLMDVHHIVFDGISLQIFLKDLVSLYSNETLEPLKLQYRDYADWYFSEGFQTSLDSQKSFWMQELNGFTNKAILPADYKKSKEISFEGAYLHFTIDAAKKKAIQKLGADANASLFSVLTSFYSILQAKLTGVDDLAIGTPVAGRRHWDLDKIIGMFVNTLAIRMIPRDNMNFQDYLKEVSTKILNCFDNQEYPYETLLEDLGSRRSNELSPLFDTLITLDNFKQSEIEINDLSIKTLEVTKSTSKYDLIMHFYEKGEELGCTLEYSTKLFKKETVERFFHYFNTIVDQVCQNQQIALNDISLLDAAAEKSLLEINDFTEVEFPGQLTLMEVFENQVAQSPDKVALVMGNKSMTYIEVNERANQIARLLRDKNVGPNNLVGVLLEKDFDVVISMLGILKAGGAYVPIDINYPQNRIDYIIENSGLNKVLTAENYSSIITDNNVENIFISEAQQIEDTSNLPLVNSPHDLCYIIYTSGTTGNPKGVMIEHKNVIRLFINEKTPFKFSDKDVWTMFHSHCFDFSVWEMYGPLLFGGKLVIVSADDARDPWKFLEIVTDHQVTVLSQTPTSFYNFMKESTQQNANLDNLQYVIFGGEALTPSKLKDWNALYPKTKLINMYGITEVTVHMTYKEIGESELEQSASNIGRALDTGSVYLLDKNKQPVPIGVVGEIYVGGEGVARGYRNNEELTASRFINNPFKEGDRLYRSGDLAILLDNGDLEYKGRIDNQVQLKGFRIELSEIEHQLQQHELVSNSVVIKRESKKGEPFLCAYYTAKEELNVTNLRAYLEKCLPHYMVPSYFVKIDDMPYTSNNKIDVNKLPEPSMGVSDKDYVKPTTDDEIIMAEVWQDQLEIERVGVKDNFFSLGGDSLKAIALISTINEKLSSSLIIADIYSNPTIKELVESVNSKKGEDYALLKQEAEKELSQFQEDYKRENPFLDNYEEVYPMNGIEKGMVYHSLLGNTDDIHSIMYHEQNMYDVPFDNFDFEVFKEVLNLMVKKHSELRKIYDLKNLAHIILKEIEPDVHFIDICHLKKEEQVEFIEKKLHEEKLRKTELNFSLIWRMNIIKVREGFQYLIFDFNHSLFDGWSLASFLTELNNTAIAFQNDSNFVVQNIQGSYKDQILGELTAINSESSMNYWKKELTGYKRFELAPTGKPHQFITDDFGLGKQYRKDLTAVAKKLNTSFKHLCFAAAIHALRRSSFENDVTLGVVTNIRPLIPDGEKLLGCFLNTVPFRVQTPDDLTWKEYVEFIEHKFTELKYHERVPFYKILEYIDEKTFNANPVYDVKLNYIDFRVYNDFKGYKEKYFGPSNARKNYLNENTLLNLHILANNDDFIFRIVYSTSYFEDEQSKRLASYFKNTLDQILEDSSVKQTSKTVLLEEEFKTVTQNFNDTEVAINEKETILDLFNKQVKLVPNKVAAEFEADSITYKELDEQSNQLAHKLIELGVSSETLVPICLDRSLDMIMGILAILKAGGAYVPIDPDYPQNRIKYILDDVDSSLILTQANYQDLFEIDSLLIDQKSIYDRFKKTSPEIKVDKDSLAYVIYTSGTTGQPKGVMNIHAGIHNRLVWMRDYFNVTNEDTILQKTSFCFDVSVWELMLPMITGAKLVFAKVNGHKEPSYLKDLLIQQGVTMMHFVPSMLATFLQNIEELDGAELKSVICSGEELKASTVKDFQAKLPAIGLYNLYGPTEAAIDVTCQDLTNYDNADIVSIGEPIANTQIYIVDSQNNIQSVGVKGEMLIGGVQVARGYLNKPELTNQKFIANPFNQNDPYKLYRTGDIARWLPDGRIEYLGRIDNQIKLRGYRIELGEIENCLLENPDIMSAAVDYREYLGEFSIVAYYVADQESEIEADALKEYLKERIPENMIPSYFVEMEELPINFNGKLDKSALPDPEILRTDKHENPSNETEEKLLAIWSEILKIDEENISVITSFFNVGGHSLKAISMVNAIFKCFSVEVPLTEVFERQTIRNISEYIDANHEVDTSSSEMSRNSFGSIPKATESSFYPLSSAQKRMYFQYMFNKDSLLYNMPLVYKMKGQLNLQALENAYKKLVEHHESLRMLFELNDGVPVQHLAQADEFKIDYVEDADLPLDASIDDFVRPFELSKELPFRVRLVKESDNSHVLMMDMHHIISDGISMQLLTQDFWQLYKGDNLEAKQIQYKDYAVWQQSDSYKQLVETHKSFWLDTFSEEVVTLELPTDHQRPHILSSEGFSDTLLLNEEQSNQLRALACRENVTMYNLFLGIYNLFLHKMTNEVDIVVGTPTAGRHHADLEGLVGMFVNTVPLRNKLNTELSFSEFIQNLQFNTLSAFDHQLFQYEDLVDALSIPRNMNRNPLFDVFYSYNQHDDALDIQESDISIDSYEVSRPISKFDLSLNIFDDSEIRVSFMGRSDLFEQSTIKSFTNYFNKIIDSLLENKSQSIKDIELLSKEEKDQLLISFNNTDVTYDLSENVVKMFQNSVVQNPGAKAIVFGDESITYKDLDKRSTLWASHLIQSGVQSGDVVGLIMSRSIEMIVAILATMKAGAAYLPIDPEQPKARTLPLLEESKCQVVIGDLSDNSEKLKSSYNYLEKDILDEQIEEVQSFNELLPEDLAYIIYTSGSTGTPKGVLTQHQGLTNFIKHERDFLAVDASDSILQFSPYYFDASVKQIWLALTTGAKLVLVDKNTLSNSTSFIDYLQKNEISTLNCTPSFLQGLDLPGLPHLKRIIASGEECKASLARRYAEEYEFYNEYGPTETTVIAVSAKVDPKTVDNSKVSIGRPIANTKALILDDNLNLVPIGAMGHLYISGAGVSKGYLNNSELTENQFVENQYYAGKMYRTGDLAKWRPDGTIDYLGRSDNQIKLNGIRIELGEIESHLNNIESVNEIAVDLRTVGGNKSLVAYYTAQKSISNAEFRAYLIDQLPFSMVPYHYIQVDQLPLTSNGKLDRAQLPSPDQLERVYKAPTNDTEELLVSIFASLLEKDADEIGIDDGFFELGGNSLKAISLVNEISKVLLVKISLKEVFVKRTVKEISEFILTVQQMKQVEATNQDDIKIII